MQRLPAPAMPDWITAMLPPRTERYRVDVGGYEMHVMEVGEGRPVLMVHGNPTWGFLYRKVAAALAGAPFRLIMPDLIGLGFSDRCPDDEHQLDNHCRWMAALIDAIELRDAIGVGQDWGGPVCFGALADRPGVATGLVILNTVVSPPRPGFKSTAFHRFARMPIVSDVAFRALGFPQIALWAAQGDKSTMRGEVARAYRYPLRSRRDNNAPLALARMVPNGPDHPSIPRLQKCREYLEAFEGPIEVVWGDRDPVLGSVRGWVEKLLPNAHVKRTGAGHFLQEEVPDEIAAAITRFAV
jgi:haloalkane dehalogenase